MKVALTIPDPIFEQAEWLVRGFRRPVVIVQADRLNRSLIATVICVPFEEVGWDDVRSSNVAFYRATLGAMKSLVEQADRILSG